VRLEWICADDSQIQVTEILPSLKHAAAGAETSHSRASDLLFRLRIARRRMRRGIADFFEGLSRCEKMHDGPYSLVVAESRSKLWSDERPAEAVFQKGKIHNLRMAAQELDDVLLLPGEIFSFWKQVGRATRERGYVVGRMLQQGCLVPAVGGGLCQLSNALYDAALQSGCEIVERHAHSRVVPGSAAAAGRDATVAWNYVDLRFRSRVPLLIRARLTQEELAVSFCAFPGTVVPRERPQQGRERAMMPSDVAHGKEPTPEMVATCATCEHAECFRHEREES